jgi:hypothetical protein
MSSKAIIGLCVLLNFIAFGRLAWLYIWPRLQEMDREEALQALVVPHMFRFVGLSFLMPGVVSPTLDPAFANPAAYGDLIATLLAIAASLALSARASWGIALVWLLNIAGTVDLLLAYWQGMVAIGLPPGALAAAFFIPTMIVPPLLVTHALMFRMLLWPIAARPLLARTGEQDRVTERSSQAAIEK